jgi:hypothetical protein
MKKDPSVRALLEILSQERTRVSGVAAGILRENLLRCAAHGHVAYGDAPASVPGYKGKAHAMRAGFWAGAILGSAGFALLNHFSLNGNWLVVLCSSLSAAALFGCLGSSVVERFAAVDVMNPRSTVRADRLLQTGGLTSLICFAAFAYLRFAESGRWALPAVSMFFETGTLMFCAASRELVSVYRFPEDDVRAYAEARGEIQDLDRKIRACETLLKLEGKNEDDDQPSSGVHHEHGPHRGPGKPNGAADHADLS